MSDFYPAIKPTFTPVQFANEQDARLNWLARWNAEEQRRARIFRHPREEEQMLLLRSPIPTQEAYALFGMLLGTFPPAAIFYRLFASGLNASEATLVLLPCLPMLIACVVVGKHMGAKVGKTIDEAERETWNVMLVQSLEAGFIWAAATGAAGGALCFLIGALFGLACALPVGLLAFALFTPLHRLTARGGMIDARHFWPLASGIVLAITALILSPYIYP
ncbi:MAG: hypothetical protein ACR2G4_15745 [Pyrinomonadaceae bacterium]